MDDVSWLFAGVAYVDIAELARWIIIGKWLRRFLGLWEGAGRSMKKLRSEINI